MIPRVALVRTTRRKIPEDAILHSHRRENLKAYISFHLLWEDAMRQERSKPSFGGIFRLRQSDLYLLPASLWFLVLSYSATQKLWPVWSSETSAEFQRTRRRYSSEVREPQILHYFYFWGWIGIKSTITAAIYWSSVTARMMKMMVMIVEQLVEWSHPSSNPDRRGGKSASTRLSYWTANPAFIWISCTIILIN
jgi:hypothetical protein